MPGGGKTVTRVELYDAVYRRVGFSRSESSALAELVLKEISDSVAKGETVKLSSFGTFKVRQKENRIGRNPKTGKNWRTGSRYYAHQTDGGRSYGLLLERRSSHSVFA